MVPLQVKSMYSLLQSPIRPQQLVTAVKEQGYSAVALADDRVLYGAYDFYQAATKEQLNPLMGAQFHLQFGALMTQSLHVLAYAMSKDGYQTLMRWSTQQLTAPDQANLAWETVQADTKDLLLVIPPQLLATDAEQIASLNHLQATFGDRLYLGISLEQDAAQRTVVQSLAQATNLPIVACERVDYLQPTDHFATQVLHAIGAKQAVAEPLVAAQQLGTAFLKPAAQVEQAYEALGLGEAVANNTAMATRCHWELTLQAPVLPKFPTPNGEAAIDYLRTQCLAGLNQRTLAPGKTVANYEQRLNRELATIDQMGFADYFLIVWDVMAFAHRTKITTGPGRGSAAGSLVAYALAITDVDPLQYDLLFERFLNPERIQMPDIDLDFPDNRRDEVLAYVHQKYGHDRVAQIITFGTLAARQAINDVANVLQVPKYQLGELQQMIRHQTRGNQKLTLAQIIKASQPLQNLMADDELIHLVVTTAEQLEGLPRNASTHAAGVVLADEPLIQTVPLQTGRDNGILVTQFPKDPVEALGLLKMDFLGLRNLSIVDATLKLIRQTEPAFTLAGLDLNDRATLQLFQQGETDGVFQFESSGIRRVLKQLRPDRFEDIVAVNALYRPGPMENIAHFIARKHGQEPINYPASQLAPILAPTYGILVYQEQVMQVAVTLAGFSLGQADMLRRAMGKKKQSVMEAMRDQFLQGAQQRGIDQAVAMQVFDYMDRFANYGFNRSHAVAYSKMAFQMAALKRHRPQAFFAALLQLEANADKQLAHFEAAKRLGVKILHPHINHSQADFALEHGQLRMGLNAIRGLGRDFIHAILTERQAHGDYQNLNDFISRLDDRWQTEKNIAPLIYVGAFDQLGYNRAELIDALPGLLEGATKFGSLAATFAPIINQRSAWPLTERLAKESEYLGIYLSGHPVNQYAHLKARLQLPAIAQLRPGKVRVLALVNRMREVQTKRDRKAMAFLTLSDDTGNLEATVFPRQFQEFGRQLKANQIYVVTGKTEWRDDHLQLIVDQVQLASDVQAQFPTQRWVLRLQPSQYTEQFQADLAQIQQQFSGPVPVILYNAQTNQAQQTNFHWQGNEQVQAKLVTLLGADNVVLQDLSE